MGDVTPVGEQAKTTTLSSVSRMTDAARFEEFSEVDVSARQVPDASQVAGIMDGADRVQGVLDLHRLDTLRILDFPHAAQRVSAILETLQQAGRVLPPDATARCLHLLTHRGSRPILHGVRHLIRGVAETGTRREDLEFVQKREPFMPYPVSQADDWPGGSGMVERATTRVMQARLTGAGMQWQASPVNPMLALRTSVRNDR
jgi:hypothetical protein